MAVALAMDVSLPITAGALISGAYFGDKLSPLSDTTNMATIAAGMDLYQSIRNMLYTSQPAFVFACIGFYLLGDHPNRESDTHIASIGLMKTALSSLFWLHPLLLTPALLVFGGGNYLLV